MPRCPHCNEKIEALRACAGPVLAAGHDHNLYVVVDPSSLEPQRLIDSGEPERGDLTEDDWLVIMDHVCGCDGPVCPYCDGAIIDPFKEETK